MGTKGEMSRVKQTEKIRWPGQALLEGDTEQRFGRGK